jgi:HK97 gp10 family phage protein
VQILWQDTICFKEKVMRVANWNPKVGDKEIFGNAMDRLQKAAEVVASNAKARCPVGKNVSGKVGGKDWTARESGALKASIRVVLLYGDDKRNIRLYAGSRKVFYARFVEYGTTKMSAKPFLRPALNSSRSQIKSIIEGA